MLELNILEDIINKHFNINLRTRLKSKKSVIEYEYKAAITILIHIANKKLGISYGKLAERYDKPSGTITSSFYYKNRDRLAGELKFDYKGIYEEFLNETSGFIAVREDMVIIKDILNQAAELNYKMIKASNEIRGLMEKFNRITKKYEN